MALNVVLNCAMSLDGCIGLPGPRPLWLSGPEDLQRVHELRAASDAILVGVGTVKADDPKLTVKWELLGRRGRNPTRVVLDARVQTPPGALVLDGEAPTLVFHGKRGGAMAGRAELVRVDVDGEGLLDLGQVLGELERRGMGTLLVEGGMLVLSSFLRSGKVDEFTIYVAPILVGAPDAPRLYSGDARSPLGLRLDKCSKLGDGVLMRFVRP